MAPLKPIYIMNYESVNETQVVVQSSLLFFQNAMELFISIFK